MKSKVFLMAVLLVFGLLVLAGYSDDSDVSLLESEDAKLAALDRLLDGNEAENAERAGLLSAIHRDAFSNELLALYARKLEEGKRDAVFDIANTRGLWSVDFVDPLVVMFLSERRDYVREKIADSLAVNAALNVQVRRALMEGLEKNGEFSFSENSPSPQFIRLVAKIGHPAALKYLAKLLDSERPSYMGMSPVAGWGPPSIRICDCAHDAILVLCGGCLEARVAMAFQEAGFTNEFDPRQIQWLPRNLELADVIPDPTREPVVHDADPSEELWDVNQEKELFRQVVVVRDIMLKHLRADLSRAESK